MMLLALADGCDLNLCKMGTKIHGTMLTTINHLENGNVKCLSAHVGYIIMDALPQWM